MLNAIRGDLSHDFSRGEELTTRSEKCRDMAAYDSERTPETMLPENLLKQFARVFHTNEDYLRIMGDLCTVREHLSSLFQYEGTPLRGNTEHPIFKIATTLDEIIGALLTGEHSLTPTPTQYGKIITLTPNCTMSGKVCNIFAV